MGNSNNDLELTEEEIAKKDAADADSEEEKKLYKKRGWQHKLRLGRHYRMERFSVLFFSLLSMLLVLSGFAWNMNRRAENELVSTKAIYTTDIEFSLSGVTGEVVDVYRNTDGTRAYVLLSMSDLSRLSLDTNDYEMFLTGFNKQLRQEPSASMFMFGTKGYIGLEFYDERGLSNEIFHATIRNNSLVTDVKELTEAELAELEDSSFGTNDQADLYVNVGAEEATVMDVLDQDLDSVQLYYALVGREEENEVFATIDEQTKELQQLMNEQDEYMRRLETLGYEAPSMPEFMKGDTFDDDGHYEPAYMVQGSHNIEYINRRSTDGFVTQVVDDPSRFRNYMAEKRATEQKAQQSARREDDPETSPIVDELIRNDGFTLVLSELKSNEATSADLSARDSVNSLKSIWGQYLRVKRDLQIESMRELLLLDAEIRTQSQAFSANTDSEFLTIY